MYNFKEGETFNKFLLEKKLGEGSTGQVWKARDTIINRIVALKILDSELEEKARQKNKNITLQETFLQEARNLGRLQQTTIEEQTMARRIAQVYEANIDKKTGSVYIAQEFVEGKTLATLLNEGKPPEIRTFIQEILEGLSYAHEKGVIHGDLSIHNVMNTPTGGKIIDFGIGTLGVPTSILYLAPEVLQNPNARSPQSDLWSVGVILYRLKYGTYPFKARRKTKEEHDNAKTTLDDVVKTPEEYQKLKKEITSPKEEQKLSYKMMYDSTERLLYKLLRKKTEDRPKSAKKAKQVVEIPDGIGYLLKRIIPIGIALGITGQLCLWATRPEEYVIAISAKNRTEAYAYDTNQSGGTLIKVPMLTNIASAKYLKKYQLKKEPDILIPSTHGRYALYGTIEQLYILDTKTGESERITTIPATEKSILFDEHIHIIDTQGTYFNINPQMINDTIVTTTTIFERGQASTDDITGMFKDDDTAYVSTRVGIYDMTTNKLFISGDTIQEITYYKEKRAFICTDSAIQQFIPIEEYKKLLQTANIENVHMPNTGINELEKNGIHITGNVGGHFYTITIHGRKALFEGNTNEAVTPPYIEESTSISAGENKVFYTTITQDKNNDGILNTEDSTIHVYDTKTKMEKEWTTMPIEKVVVLKTEYKK